MRAANHIKLLSAPNNKPLSGGAGAARLAGAMMPHERASRAAWKSARSRGRHTDRHGSTPAARCAEVEVLQSELV
jgi:hypothetical protein